MTGNILQRARSRNPFESQQNSRDGFHGEVIADNDAVETPSQIILCQLRATTACLCTGGGINYPEPPYNVIYGSTRVRPRGSVINPARLITQVYTGLPIHFTL